MERKIAENMIEELASLSVSLENLSKKIRVEERKSISKELKNIWSRYFELLDLVGKQCPEIHPHYLGLEQFEKLRKKHEDPEFPIDPPSQEEVEDATRIWNTYYKPRRK